MNLLKIFIPLVILACFAADSYALPVKAAESANSEDVVVAVPLKLIDVERSNQSAAADGGHSSNVELKRTARGLGLGFGGKFGSFGGLGHGLKGFSGGFGGLGGLGGHGLGGSLGLLKFKPFFNKFG